MGPSSIPPRPQAYVSAQTQAQMMAQFQASSTAAPTGSGSSAGIGTGTYNRSSASTTSTATDHTAATATASTRTNIHAPRTGGGGGNGGSKTRPGGTNRLSAFDTQRAQLIGEIAQSLDHAVQNLNQLNRSIESITAVGEEFAAVEGLWSRFEGYMGPDVGDLHAPQPKQQQ